MAEYLKPIPRIDEVSKTYWKGTQRRELLIQECLQCGHKQFYPRPFCLNCSSDSLVWTKASGRGKVHTFTVVHRNTQPGFVTELPYVFAIVELEEGPRMQANIINCKPEEVKIGMPVTVVFQTINQDVTLPQFRPAGG